MLFSTLGIEKGERDFHSPSGLLNSNYDNWIVLDLLLILRVILCVYQSVVIALVPVYREKCVVVVSVWGSVKADCGWCDQDTFLPID